MQEKNKKKSNFFDRILQIIDYYGIKNVRTFACDYLGYTSMQKINRLQDEGTSPSYDILVDISNKFDEISMDWLLTGRGEMLKNSRQTNNVRTNKGIVGIQGNSNNVANYGNEKEYNELLLLRLDKIIQQNNILLNYIMKK